MSRRTLNRAMRQVDRNFQRLGVLRQDFLAANVEGPTKTVVGSDLFRCGVEKRGWQKCRNEVLRELARPGAEVSGNARCHDPSERHERTARRSPEKLGERAMALIEVEPSRIVDHVAQSY